MLFFIQPHAALLAEKVEVFSKIIRQTGFDPYSEHIPSTSIKAKDGSMIYPGWVIEWDEQESLASWVGRVFGMTARPVLGWKNGLIVIVSIFDPEIYEGNAMFTLEWWSYGTALETTQSWSGVFPRSMIEWFVRGTR